MIVVDTSVWADHFRSPEPHLVFLWSQASILQHPLVTGELAMGNLSNWATTVGSLSKLPQAQHLPEAEVLAFVKGYQLMGSGIGFIDAHILASVAHEIGVSLWTRDKRLAAQAEQLGVVHDPG